MRIENLTTRKNGDLFRVGATLIWEDRDRAPQEIYFETTSDFANDLSCNPHAFLVGTVITALCFGEKRLSIDADICSQLLDGLHTAMLWIRHWQGNSLPTVEIEAKVKRGAEIKPALNRAGVCYSGGIDSLATLRSNRLKYPSDHPRSFKDGLLIHGISNTTLESYEKTVYKLSPVADDAGITLVPVYTNIYHHLMDLEDENYTLIRFYMLSAALSAVGHAFHKRLGSLSISSSEDIRSYSLCLFGTNPILDPNYSSYNLQIHHADIALSRLDKTRLVASWDIALQNLRVCNELELPEGYLNCGVCRKCVITMATLSAMGLLKRTKIFPQDEITPEFLFERAQPQFEDEVRNYLDLLPLFEASGQQELARGIKQLATRFYWRHAIKEVDRQYLNSTITRFYQNVQRRKA